MLDAGCMGIVWVAAYCTEVAATECRRIRTSGTIYVDDLDMASG